MENVLEIATNISTPLGLGGFVAAAFFLIVLQVLKKASTREIVVLIINRLFLLSLAAMVLGFLGYVTSIVVSAQSKQHDQLPGPPQKGHDKSVVNLVEPLRETVPEQSQPPDGQPPIGTQLHVVVVKVQSDPDGADTYLDWKLKGQTPVSFEAKETSGLLVVVKDGYRAGFRQIDSRERGPIRFTLAQDSTRPRRRLLLVISEGASREVFTPIKGSLMKQGFTVLGREEAGEFQRELRRAGGLAHQGLRYWARARFETDLLLVAHVRQSTRQLSEQEFGYGGIQEAIKGAVRSEVGIDLELVDLSSGDRLAAVSGTGVGFTLDRDQGLQKALTQAAAESAKRLWERTKG